MFFNAVHFPYLSVGFQSSKMKVFYLGLLVLISGSESVSYTQEWLRGEGPQAHPHEGIMLADRSGWVAIGELLPADLRAENFQVRLER